MNYAMRKKRFIEISEKLVDKIKELRYAEADLFLVKSQQIHKEDAKFTPEELEKMRLATLERVSLYNDELNILRLERGRALRDLKREKKEVSCG